MYIPISILPTISKLIETWVDINFSLFLNNFNLLHKSQSAFRAKHSTESAMILMVDSWFKALNPGKLVGCVMVDFRKAFDLVDHKILLKNYAPVIVSTAPSGPGISGAFNFSIFKAPIKALHSGAKVVVKSLL